MNRSAEFKITAEADGKDCSGDPLERMVKIGRVVGCWCPPSPLITGIREYIDATSGAPSSDDAYGTIFASRIPRGWCRLRFHLWKRKKNWQKKNQEQYRQNSSRPQSWDIRCVCLVHKTQWQVFLPSQACAYFSGVLFNIVRQIH